MARPISLPLTRDEILALDAVIRDGLVMRYPLTRDEKVALSVWNGATHDLRTRPFLSRLRDVVSPIKNELERWFDEQESK